MRLDRKPLRGRRGVGALVVLCLAVIALVVSACSGGATTADSSTGGTPVKGGTLTAAVPSDPTTLDWGINTDALTIDIAQNMFETLFAPDKSFAIRPMLASGYTMSDGGRTYTINLRSGVKFQNGQTMTSADVVASMDRWFLVSGEGQNVKKDVDSVTAQGDNAVVVKLKAPRYSFISSLASFLQACIILPASVAKAAGTQTLTDAQLIGTGPYKFQSYVHGQYVELTRFDQYSARTENWGGLAGKKVAYIDNLKFQVVSDTTQRINGLRTGLWQFAATLDLDNYQQVSTDPTMKAYGEANSLVEFALLNSGHGAFSNVKARQALNTLIDKNAMADATLGPATLWKPLSGAFALPDNKPMYSTAGENVYANHNAATAKQMFAAAGVTGPINILTTHTYPNFYQMAVVLQSELQSIGIKANVEVYDFPTMIAKLTSSPNDWDISMTAFAGEPLNPNQLLFLSPTWPGGFKSDTINTILAQYDASTTADQAHAAVVKLQQAVWDEVPDIAIGKQDLLSAGSTNLKDYENFIGQGFWNAYLATS
jgi:peptide/nickel transport system substrate-binding protein